MPTKEGLAFIIIINLIFWGAFYVAWRALS